MLRERGSGSPCSQASANFNAAILTARFSFVSFVELRNLFPRMVKSYQKYFDFGFLKSFTRFLHVCPHGRHSCVLIYVSDENCDIIADPPFNLHIRRPYTFITPALQCGRRAAENFSGFPGIEQAWHPFL